MFDLLETLRWTPAEGFLLLERHLERMRGSARDLGFPFERRKVEASLDEIVAREERPLRIRILLSRAGDVRVEHRAFEPCREPVRLRLAKEPIDSTSAMLFHKTTARDVYERARLSQCDDVVLWNENGHVTEATTANIILEIGGVKVTPNIKSGLLPGTYRADLLARGDVTERVVTLDEFRRAQGLWVTNSVHGVRLATRAGEPGEGGGS